jgi:aminoglycoside 6'-N-acetyltransferase I
MTITESLMQIMDLQPDNRQLIEAAAALLVVGFREHSPAAWPDRESALAEVHEALAADRVCRAAVAEDGTLLGWIGAISGYHGHAWELHPLVVHTEYRRRGIGRALALDLEEQVRRRGAVTLYLGTDDEDDQTSLSGVDLYPDVYAHVARIENRHDHPYGFYQKLGFVIVGVLPDANGLGKPDIWMAKRVLGEQ